MKIGLLTYHAACNFGANLQALSTVNYWRNRGHEPIFINWVPDDLMAYYQGNTNPLQMQVHKEFREEYFPMTRRCKTDKDVAEVIKEEGIEAVVVGSDAVMKTSPKRSRYFFPTRRIISFYKPTTDAACPNPFWGSYCHLLDKKIPLCYMSASSQNSRYRSSSRSEKQMQKDLLMQYSYISTRDDWTSNQVKWLTDGLITPQITPDPVFAFNYNIQQQPTAEDIKKRFNLKDKYCLFSFHSSNVVTIAWLKEVQEKLNSKGVQCIAFPFPQGIQFKHPLEKEIGLPLSPLDWYYLIKYAYAYVGENMHPIVIALHNAVPCYSFDQYGKVKLHYFVNEKSSKVYHILNQFGCLNNRISIQGNYTAPSVDHVLQCLEFYDKDKVREVANSYLERYKKMMLDIETVITENI
jgi:hypothetical protein